ncbi:MAG: glycosyltransferase family 4 protein [bacterium]|nr:glycosyltransferase family 4 protein [bacterium]
MKIILATRSVYPFQGYGGMEEYVYFLAKYLLENGNEVEIITNSINGKVSKEVYNNITYTFIPLEIMRSNQKIKKAIIRPYTYHRFSWNVAKYLKTQNFDILHAFGGTAIYYLFENQRNRKPVVFQTFGNEPWKDTGLVKIYNYLVWYIWTWWLFYASDLVASEGEDQTDEIIKLFNIKKDKIFLLPDGIDLKLIDESILNCKITREDIGLSKDDFVTITVSRLDSVKRIDLIIEAFRIICKRIPHAKLVIIGAGQEEENLHRLISQYDLSSYVLHFKNLEFTTLYKYLSLADVFINASLQNVLLISVLEAMACGLPVISSDNQEGLVINDKTGYVVGTKNVDGIVDRIFKIYSTSISKQMGENAQETVKSYSWDSIAKIAIEKYKELINKKRVKINDLSDSTVD